LGSSHSYFQVFDVEKELSGKRKENSGDETPRKIESPVLT
jgi:hypothetical protein